MSSPRSLTPAARRARVVRASVLGLVSQLVVVAVAIWSTPYIVHGLGDASYSLLAVLGSFTSYFAYLELGIGTGYIRALASAIARGDDADAQRQVETAHALYLRIATVGATAMTLLGIPYMLHVAGGERGPLLVALAITAATFLGTMALSTTRGLVIAAQRTDLYAAYLLVAQPIVPVVQVIAVSRGGGIVAVTAVQCVFTVLVDLTMYVTARRLQPALTIRAHLHRDVWRELRTFSLWRFVANLSQQGQWNGDRLLLGSMVAPALIAPYALAASLAARARSLGITLLSPFFPAAVEEHAAHGADGVARLTARYGGTVAALLAVGVAAGWFWASPLLAAWVGERYAVAGSLPLQLLLVATYLLVVGAVLSQATDALGVPRVGAISASAGLIAAVAVSVPLVRWLGPVGAAWGFCAGALVPLPYNLWALGKLAPNALPRLLTSCLALPAIVFAAALGTMHLVPHGARLTATLPSLFAGCAVGLIAATLLGLLGVGQLRSLRRAG